MIDNEFLRDFFGMKNKDDKPTVTVKLDMPDAKERRRYALLACATQLYCCWIDNEVDDISHQAAAREAMAMLVAIDEVDK